MHGENVYVANVPESSHTAINGLAMPRGFQRRDETSGVKRIPAGGRTQVRKASFGRGFTRPSNDHGIEIERSVTTILCREQNASTPNTGADNTTCVRDYNNNNDNNNDDDDGNNGDLVKRKKLHGTGTRAREVVNVVVYGP